MYRSHSQPAIFGKGGGAVTVFLTLAYSNTNLSMKFFDELFLEDDVKFCKIQQSVLNSNVS